MRVEGKTADYTLGNGDESKESTLQNEKADTDTLRILVDIKMSNGLHFQQRYLSYRQLRQMVEKLEVLC